MNRLRAVGLLAGLALTGFSLAGCGGGGDAGAPGRDGEPAPPQAYQDESVRAGAVVNGLQPAIQFAGEEPVRWTLRERMEEWNVPGLSLAVLAGPNTIWQARSGLADTETGEEVTIGTPFQAASISKPVAALVALSLVEDGVLGLDDPVNDHLTSWKIPDNTFTADSSVTLRHLLTHTAGLTVWGFPGYRKDQEFRPGQPVATNVQVLDGQGNTDPVRVYKVPGESWQYSGGGFTVMEQLVEDVTGRPFEAVAWDRVLRVVGMNQSTFEVPLPQERWPVVSRGHLEDGEEVTGEWHNYPEQAAAGLWTTPTDLVNLSAHLNGILRGRVRDGVLSREMVEAMLTPHGGGAPEYNTWGLGVALQNGEGYRAYSHGGSNAGFRAQWFTLADRGQGLAVMTNGERGGALAGEILRAVATAYDWPVMQPEIRERRAVADGELDRYTGRYQARDGSMPEVVISPAPEGGVLEARIPDYRLVRLVPVADGPHAFVDPVDGQDLVFQVDEGGAVVGLTAGGQRLDKR